MVQAALGFGSNIPGYTPLRETQENTISFQTFFMGDVIEDPMPVIDATATDAGNTGLTLVLRPGLLMGRLDSNGAWVPYDPKSILGNQVAAGVLVHEVNMLDYSTGSGAARLAITLVTKGKLKAAAIVNLDQQARNQLAKRGFDFDDNRYIASGTPDRIVPKTTSYTVVAADSGTFFTTTGAAGSVTFTLPTIAPGLYFEFMNTVDQTMAVTSAEGSNVITDNNLVASTVTFSTASHKIGARVIFQAMYVNSVLKWFASGQTNAQTVT